MVADENRRAIRRSRPVDRAPVPAGPAGDLADAIYRLYAEADCPRLDDLADMISDDEDLDGAPKKDLISKIISGAELATQQDTVSVAVMLARQAGRRDVSAVARAIRDLWINARTTFTALPERLGRPVSGCDPISLEVHPSIEVGVENDSDVLPAYVERAHDVRLREIADAVMLGESRMVTLVSGSSTGKTRACWELVQYLERREPGRWRLWHPYDPSRPQAAAAEIGRAGPYTIIWLNEAQFYLAAADVRLSERIAAGLRSLLQDPTRQPVLVLATLWRQYWSLLTARPDGAAQDPYAQARELLTGTRVNVPDKFGATDLARLTGPGVDQRLRQAAARALDGRITQYLAGAPELEARYRTASAAARAIVEVAVDARRVGYPMALPRNLLQQAAAGYLDDDEWDGLSDDWMAQALAETARPANGARGPLTRIRPRSGASGDPPNYRLADYLEETVRLERASIYPPGSLWTAFDATIADAELLRQLAQQAQDRGRYQHAVMLFARAASLGDIDAWWDLAIRLEEAGDARAASRLALQAAERGDLSALRDIAERHEEAGNHLDAAELALAAIDRGDTDVAWTIIEMREQVGNGDRAIALALAAADHGDLTILWKLAGLREEVSDTSSAAALYRAAAERGDSDALCALAELREDAGDDDSTEALFQEAAARGNLGALRELAVRREERGDPAGALTLYREAANLGDTLAMCVLAEWRQETGDLAGAAALYRDAANLGDTGALHLLAAMRDENRDAAAADALYREAADLGDTSALRTLAERTAAAGDVDGAERMYRRASELGDAMALPELTLLLEQKGDRTGAEILALDAADAGATYALRGLAMKREEEGDFVSAERLYRQSVDRGDEVAFERLLARRRRTGDSTGAEAAYRQAADRGDARALMALFSLRQEAQDLEGATKLVLQAADRGDIWFVRRLVERSSMEEAVAFEAADRGVADPLLRLLARRWRQGDETGILQLRRRAADRPSVGVLRALAEHQAHTGDYDAAAELYRQAVDHGDVKATCALAVLLERRGDAATAEYLAVEAAGRGATKALRDLATRRQQAGNLAGAEALCRVAIDHGDIGALRQLVVLRRSSGDGTGADRLRRFGLTGDGTTASGLDFGSFGGFVH